MQRADPAICKDLSNEMLPGTNLYTVISADSQPPMQVLLSEHAGKVAYVVVMYASKWIICPWVSSAIHTILCSLPSPALKLQEVQASMRNHACDINEMKAAIAKRSEAFSAELKKILEDGESLQARASAAFQSSVLAVKEQS